MYKNQKDSFKKKLWYFNEIIPEKDMAKISQNRLEFNNKVIVFEKTVKCFKNNSLLQDFYLFCRKVIDERCILEFVGITPDIITLVKNVDHLNNYFKMFSEIKEFGD